VPSQGCDPAVEKPSNVAYERGWKAFICPFTTRPISVLDSSRAVSWHAIVTVTAHTK